jgi:monothiol glutaredoxin
MDVNERIKQQLSEFPVLLYMKGSPDFPQCGFSAQAVAALRALGSEFAHVNIFEDPKLREAQKLYSSPALRQGRAGGRLRHRAGDVPHRRAEKAPGGVRRRHRQLTAGTAFESRVRRR